MTRRPSFRPGRRATCKGLLSLSVGFAGCGSDSSTPPGTETEGGTTTGAPEPIDIESLPEPNLTGAVSIESVLANRRSIRTWTGEALTRAELGQLLWAAQGITDPSGKRTAPSAGALYPLQIYVLTPEGIHHYRPEGHEVALLSTEDVRARVPAQDFVQQGPAIFLVTAVYAVTEARYGASAERFVHLEAGHAAHGLLLQAVALDLGATPVGAFDKEELMELAMLPADHEPVYVIPVGHPS